MIKDIIKFGKMCTKTQAELKRYLYGFLASQGYKVVNGDGFLYAKGTLPVCVTAHMDTVHTVQCKRYSIHRFKGLNRIQAKEGIGGDDRCGIYMICKMICDGYRPTVLFCEDEECGGIGSSKFVKTKYINDLKEMKYIVELDRANGNDAVFYRCDNADFTEYILEETGFKEASGTFSDISELCPACGIAGVNLSCGYYNAHTTKEYVLFEEMLNTIEVVEDMFEVIDKVTEKFEYIPCAYSYSKYSWMYDYDYEDNYWQRAYGYGNTTPNVSENIDYEITELEIHYNIEIENIVSGGTTKVEKVAYVTGLTEYDALGQFFEENPTICYADVIDYYVVY